MFRNKLKIISYNVNSLISHNKRISLEKFLKRHEPDLLLLSETKLNERHRLNFPKYVLIRTDKNDVGPGTAILLRSTVSFRRTYPGKLKCFQVTCVMVPLGGNQSLLVISIYIRGTPNGPDIEHDLNQINTLSQNYTYTIMGGDFNARHPLWMDSTTNRSGESIAKWLENNAHQHALNVVSQPIPTFPRTPSIIDFFICCSNTLCRIPGLENYLCKTLPSDSDHLALSLEIRDLQNFNPIIRPNTRLINYEKIDWNLFQSSLSTKLNGHIQHLSVTSTRRK